MQPVFAAEEHTMCFVARKNKTAFMTPIQNMTDSDLQLSFNETNIGSLTRDNQVVDIKINRHRGGKIIQNAFYPVRKHCDTQNATRKKTPSSCEKKLQ